MLVSDVFCNAGMNSLTYINVLDSVIIAKQI